MGFEVINKLERVLTGYYRSTQSIDRSIEMLNEYMFIQVNELGLAVDDIDFEYHGQTSAGSKYMLTLKRSHRCRLDEMCLDLKSSDIPGIKDLTLLINISLDSKNNIHVTVDECSHELMTFKLVPFTKYFSIIVSPKITFSNLYVYLRYRFKYAFKLWTKEIVL